MITKSNSRTKMVSRHLTSIFVHKLIENVTCQIKDLDSQTYKMKMGIVTGSHKKIWMIQEQVSLIEMTLNKEFS